jgi:Calcineurin-like phosphoesterase superfamily domain
MRIALIADIHGNLVALETVLQDVATESVDQVIGLGDVGSSWTSAARSCSPLTPIVVPSDPWEYGCLAAGPKERQKPQILITRAGGKERSVRKLCLVIPAAAVYNLQEKVFGAKRFLHQVVVCSSHR